MWWCSADQDKLSNLSSAVYQLNIPAVSFNIILNNTAKVPNPVHSMNRLHGISKQTLKSKSLFYWLDRVYLVHTAKTRTFSFPLFSFHPENPTQKISKKSTLLDWFILRLSLICHGWSTNKIKAATDRKREEQTATLIISTGTEVHVKHSSEVLVLHKESCRWQPVNPSTSVTLLIALSAASTLRYSWYKLSSHQDEAKPTSWQHWHLQHIKDYNQFISKLLTQDDVGLGPLIWKFLYRNFISTVFLSAGYQRTDVTPPLVF